MSPKNEVMGFALYGHLTALSKLIDQYYGIAHLLSDIDPEDAAKRDNCSAEFYREFTSMLARNHKVWGFDHEHLTGDERYIGISLEMRQNAFNELMRNLLKKAPLESHYILDYMSKMPVGELVSSAVLSAILISTNSDKGLIVSNLAFHTRPALQKAYKQSLKRAFLIQDDPNALNVGKGYLDANDLLKTYNKLLSQHLSTYPDSLHSLNLFHGQTNHWQSFLPNNLIASQHTTIEAVDNFIATIKQIDSLDEELLIVHLLDHLNESAPSLCVSSSECLIKDAVHPSVPLVGGENFFAERYFDKQMSLRGYLTWLSERPDFKAENHTDWNIEHIKNRFTAIPALVVRVYKFSSKESPPVDFRFIESSIDKLSNYGIKFDGSDEAGNDVITALTTHPFGSPSFNAKVEHYIFTKQREENATAENLQDDSSSINTFTI